MREYGQIQSSFWTDPDIQSLSDFSKMLAAYLLTSPHTNGIGCFRVPFGYVSEDFGKGLETVKKGFNELSEKGFLRVCKATQYVLIKNFLRWNPISNANVAKARQKEFDLIPEKFLYYSELCNELLTKGSHFEVSYINRFETLSKPFRNNTLTPTLPLPLPKPNPEPKPNPTSCTEPQSDSMPDCFISLTLNDKSEYPITIDQVDEFKNLYQSVDVEQQLRNMRGWCSTNPKKRKTKSGIMKFVNTWLSKEQDKFSRMNGTSQQPLTPRERAKLQLQQLEEMKNGQN